MIIDYSTYRPSAQTLDAAGITSVGRYTGWDCEPGHACIRKNLTPAEKTFLHNAGVSVFVSFEYANNAALLGAPQGTKDVTLANRQMNALGMTGCAVYYSIDFDLGDFAPHLPDTAPNARAKLGPVAHYFDAIHAGHPNHTVCAYGGFYAIKRLFDAKLITHGWQTLAWSAGQVDHRAVLVQQIKQVFGAADVNLHATSSPDWGQWPRPAAPPSGPPAVIEDGILKSVRMGWTGHKMRSVDHGATWKAVNQ
jgi:hypothetical protein